LIKMKILGIDLGTANTCMAVMEAGKPIVIPNAEGSRLTPSVVWFASSGERLAGQKAKEKAILNPERTVYSVKRFMGRRYDWIENRKDLVQYEIAQGQSNDALVKIDHRLYSPQEISAIILKKIKDEAESSLGEKIERAVITVPAYFNDSQRQATKDAGIIAGLEVVRIINEPTAAGLAYGLDREQDQIILVFDLGAGMLDISILNIGEGVFEVKATCGDMDLGGDDWDRRIMDWILEEFKKDQGIDLSKDKTTMQRVRDSAERAKIELSELNEADINLPFILVDKLNHPNDVRLILTRAKFEELSEDLLRKIEGPLRTAVADAKLTPNQIDRIILVGGPTRMPQVRNFLREYFGKEPQKDINPDECVAIGAAILGGVLVGDVKDVLLLDVIPLSLGIETQGQVFTRLIEKNVTIPTRKSKIFSTAADKQPSVEIHVLQGERPMAYDNHTLGRFILNGIPPAPKGVPQIEVTFDIDANGILNVIARDLGTQKEQNIRITATTNLSRMEIERMKREMRVFAVEDEKRKELVKIKNQADALVFAAEKFLRELGERITSDEKEEIEKTLSRLKEILKGDGATLEVKEVLEKEHFGDLLRAEKITKKDKTQVVKDAMESVNRSVCLISQRMRQEAAEQQTPHNENI
jgi:molecular chaperone DnaK